MSWPEATAYRRYTGLLRRGLWRRWPLVAAELRRGLRWRFVPLVLVALAPLLLRLAVLYVRFVVAPVRVRILDRLGHSPLASLLRWDDPAFYAGYLEDGFLWLVLLGVAAAFGVPLLARDRRTGAWELYLARGLGPGAYLGARVAALFLVLFLLTGGGAFLLYLVTALLGPEDGFFLARLGWWPALLAESVLVSLFLALTAVAFGTLGRNGLVLGGAWLGLHLLAAAATGVLRTVVGDGRYDWLDPRALCLRVGAALREAPPSHPFGTGTAALLLAALFLAALTLLWRFLRRSREVGV